MFIGDSEENSLILTQSFFDFFSWEITESSLYNKIDCYE